MNRQQYTNRTRYETWLGPEPWHRPVMDEATQEEVDDNWRRYTTRYPLGEDILSCCNLFHAYLRDGYKKPAPYYRSFVYATRILAIHSYRRGKIQQCRWWRHRLSACGLETQPDGTLKVYDWRRWLMAVSLTRQTGRCPLSTLQLLVSDPNRSPDDKIPYEMLPPLPRRGAGYKKLLTCAYPDGVIEEIKIRHPERSLENRHFSQPLEYADNRTEIQKWLDARR